MKLYYLLWTNAVLKLVLAIREGFKNKESTLPCFIDFEKEYDSSGEKEFLMMKRSRLCVNGRMCLGYYPFCRTETPSAKYWISVLRNLFHILSTSGKCASREGIANN